MTQAYRGRQFTHAIAGLQAVLRDSGCFCRYLLFLLIVTPNLRRLRPFSSGMFALNF